MQRPNARLASVTWQDLITLSPLEKAWELTLSLPWFFLSLCLYHHGCWWGGAVCSFYFFLTGLRQSHEAQHYSLGLPLWVQETLLFVLSMGMLASMHAIQVTHLHHHRHCLQPDDVEGATARRSACEALLLGPLFILRLHLAAWRLANGSKRCWILIELASIGVWLWVGFLSLPVPALQCHLAAMLVGECLTTFFAVWTVHHHCDPIAHIGRTQRNRWLNALTYHMFLHVEHHLFPAVPTLHLPLLAKRLDRVQPKFALHQVLQMQKRK